MTSATNIALLSRQEVEKLSKEHIDLKTGDRLKGEVTEVRRDGKAVVDFGKFKAALELKTPVQKGDVITVKVLDKGNQIKLKLEDIKPKAELLKEKIAQLRQQASNEPQSSDAQKGLRELRSQLDSMIQKESGAATAAVRDHAPKESREPQADLKESLGKLRQILKAAETAAAGKTGVSNIKDLGGEIKNILRTLQSYSDSLDVNEKISKPIAQLEQQIRNSDLAGNKDVRQSLEQLARIVNRLDKLQNLEQLPEIKQVLQQDLKETLLQLKDTIQKETSNQPAHRELTRSIDNLLQNAAKMIEKLPDGVGRASSAPTSQAQQSARPAELEQVLKQIHQLKEPAQQPGVQLPKETSDAIRQLTRAAEQIQQLKQPEQLPQIKTIIQNEINPNLLKLKESLGSNQPNISRLQAENPQVHRELRQTVDNLLENAQKAIDKLPDKTQPASQPSPRPPEIDNLLKQISQLKEPAQKPGVQLPKETSGAIRQLTQAAEKIQQLKGPDQLAQIKNILQQEIKPNLQKLQDSLPPPAQHSPGAENIRQGITGLLEQVEASLEALSPKEPPRPPEPQPDRRDLEQIANHIERLKALVETSGLPPQTEAAEALRDLAQSAQNLRQDPPPETIPKQLLELRPNLLRLKTAVETADPQTLRTTPARTQSAQAITNAVDNLLETLEKTLEKLPEHLKTSHQIRALLDEIKSIRGHLEKQADLFDNGDRIAQQVSQLKTMMEQAGGSGNKDIRAIIQQLARAAEQIQQIQSPEQLPQLKTILDSQLKPGLDALKTLVETAAPAANPFPAPTAEAKAAQITQASQATMENIHQRIEHLQRDIEIALEKLPDRAQAEQDIKELLQQIDKSMEKISQFSYSSPAGAPAEDIEAIFQNIRLALKQLQFNMQSGRPLFNVTPEARQALSQLQLDLKPAGLEEAVTQQLTQLNNFIETLKSSELAGDKQVRQLLNSLTQLMDRLNQLKSSNQWQQVMDTLQKELGSNLKSLKQTLSGPPFNQDLVLSEKALPFLRATENLESGLQQFIEKNAPLVQRLTEGNPEQLVNQSGQLPPDAKELLAQLPKGLQTPENISRLSELIQKAMNSPGSNAPTPNSASSLPTEVRQLLTNLRTHFEPINLGESTLKLVPKLKTLVEDSGMFFEKKVQDTIARLAEASERMANIDNLNRMPELRSILENDLKPNLMRLQDFFNSDRFLPQGEQAEAMETIRKTVDDLINNINSQQNRAVETQAQQQPQQPNPIMAFSINIPIKGQEDAQLKVFYNKGRQKDQEGNLKLSLLMDMEHLGEVRTDFDHKDRGLNVTFYVKNNGVRDLILDNLHQVEEPLEPHFDSLGLRVMVSEEKISQFQEETTPDVISDRAVDVKV